MIPTTPELAAPGAVSGVGRCQLEMGLWAVMELAATGAVSGVGPCQFDLLAGTAP